jgi:hypothetical protein
LVDVCTHPLIQNTKNGGGRFFDPLSPFSEYLVVTSFEHGSEVFHWDFILLACRR